MGESNRSEPENKKMRLILSLLVALFGTSQGYNLRNREGRRVVVESDLTIDDYGNVIERDYSHSQFINDDDSVEDDPDFVVTDEEIAEQEEIDQAISSEEVEYKDYATLPPPEHEPYLNSKFDENRQWVENAEESAEWTPSLADQEQIDEDAELDATYAD